MLSRSIRIAMWRKFSLSDVYPAVQPRYYTWATYAVAMFKKRSGAVHVWWFNRSLKGV
jgi:hypothetical protein